jgi:hypothetical protein
MQENWAPQLLASVAGAGLAIYGGPRGELVGIGLDALGLGLLGMVEPVARLSSTR